MNLAVNPAINLPSDYHNHYPFRFDLPNEFAL